MLCSSLLLLLLWDLPCYCSNELLHLDSKLCGGELNKLRKLDRALWPWLIDDVTNVLGGRIFFEEADDAFSGLRALE